ncbi:MAG TPA: pitrilysin family protein [Thermoanaerobaculia bacterium]|nr:pitrilysin family protein [Thermoanaerobaculia bacterium]
MSPVRRDDAPPPSAARGFRFPPFLHRRCPNGLQIYAARVDRVPLATLELVFPAGGHWDPAGLPGLATLSASLIDEGTAASSSLEIARRAEDLGGYLASYAEWDYGAVEVGLLASELAPAFDLLIEVATAPTFPEREIDRLKKLRTTELERRRFEPGTLADEQLARVLYLGTPYAESPLGTIDSVGRIGREEALDFYRRHYPLGSATLVAVGDLDPEALAAEIEGKLGLAPAALAPPAEPIVPRNRTGITIHLIDRPDAAQTELRLGHAAVGRQHADFVPLLLLNTLLGGKFTSRINLNLRERHGFTYGATTRLGGRLGPGPFSVATAVATESTGAAVREVLFELERIRTEPVEKDEIEETRQYITGVFPYSSQTLGDVAKRLEVLAIYDLPDDYYDGYLERIASVDRAELLELAREHIRPDQLAIVAVGPAEQLEPQLAALGPVEVVSPG